ncbi:hypothetical protein Cgig2_025458 [Carnegiea gigantea]|uniref:Uncharacterized protein n=1 Tax=Carnegiea gigantea TaxID=171969 RepID=A0A9Q1GSE8_9CARY|nr:hypothetical protein Cgig2_025458 [Carnegiea gigantea]
MRSPRKSVFYEGGGVRGGKMRYLGIFPLIHTPPTGKLSVDCRECPSHPFLSLSATVKFAAELKLAAKVLFEMVTFMDKTINGRHYLHIQPSKHDVDGEEAKLAIHNSITSFYKSNCIGGPPSLSWWSKENLKIGKTFLLSSHVEVKENLPSCQLLRYDKESSHKSWARLPLYGKFSYKPLY